MPSGLSLFRLLLATGSVVAVEPPAFGHASLAQFMLAQNYTNLNHGSYGSTPKAVLKQQWETVQQVEAAPDVFFRDNVTGDGSSQMYAQQTTARHAFAAFVHSGPDDLVFVDSASRGINAVLRSAPSYLDKRGILCTDLAYVEVQQILGYLAGQEPGANNGSAWAHPLYTVPTATAFDALLADGVAAWEDALVAGVERMLETHSDIGFAVFAHMTSTPATILPVDRLIAACRARGVLVLIDGAHVPGQLEDLNVTAVDADFYVGNGHKWMFSSKGSAFVWANPRVQAYAYPLVIDYAGSDATAWTAQFAWQGTGDYSPYLTLPAALEWRTWMGRGDPHAITRHNHNLAVEGGHTLASMWATPMLPAEITGSMVNVALPCADNCPADLAAQVLNGFNTYVPVGQWVPGSNLWWARVSAQVYNELSDFELYGRAVLAVLAAAA